MNTGISLKIEAAIRTIKTSLETHKDWAEYLEANPGEEEKVSSTVHSAKEQRKIVAEYENVLDCLRHFLNPPGAS